MKTFNVTIQLKLTRSQIAFLESAKFDEEGVLQIAYSEQCRRGAFLDKLESLEVINSFVYSWGMEETSYRLTSIGRIILNEIKPNGKL